MTQKLFMVLLGCKPPGKVTEQHDVFFGIGSSLKELVPQIIASWPEANGKIHIDVWREITCVDDNKITVCRKDFNSDMRELQASNKLFFINLGGYKRDEFDEFHYKVVVVAHDIASAIAKAKETSFFKHTGFAGAPAHVDDKYGIDVDDVYPIEDLLPEATKSQYKLVINDNVVARKNELHLGYLKLDKIK